MDGEIREAVERLNAALSETTPFRLAVVDPRELIPAPDNAHYMEKATFDNLVDNIRDDGNLGSTPLCWARPDGRLQILSGHHRVQAAIAAERPAILVLCDERELPEQHRVAVQLSHNALVGRDSLEKLRQLWMKIDDLSLKIYSGLNENQIMPPPPAELDTLREQGLQMEEVTLTFTRAEVAKAEKIMAALAKRGRKRWLADAGDFDRFLDTLLDFKEASNIVNTSTAVKAMIDLVGEWMQHNAVQQRGGP